ncbi:hypothetical protein EDB85DRAFT_1979718 [Lactarius pseudohatsudake]|nr:hypothetical protein EDB85DRAFT_1979718 [Lactarius pseudohatsudake]
MFRSHGVVSRKNILYATRPHEQHFVVTWICARSGLECCGTEIAKTRYVLLFSFNVPSILAHTGTGRAGSYNGRFLHDRRDVRSHATMTVYPQCIRCFVSFPTLTISTLENRKSSSVVARTRSSLRSSSDSASINRTLTPSSLSHRLRRRCSRHMAPPSPLRRVVAVIGVARGSCWRSAPATVSSWVSLWSRAEHL